MSDKSINHQKKRWQGSLVTGAIIASSIIIALSLALRYGSPKGGGRGIAQGMTWSEVQRKTPYLLVLWVALLLIYFLIDLITYKDKTYFICPNCQSTYENPKPSNLICQSCDVTLEPLRGYYDRHPVTDEIVKAQSEDTGIKRFYYGLNAQLFAPREITGTKWNSDLVFLLSVLPAIGFILLYSKLPPEDLSMVPFVLIYFHISVLLAGISVYFHRKIKLTKDIKIKCPLFWQSVLSDPKVGKKSPMQLIDPFKIDADSVNEFNCPDINNQLMQVKSTFRLCFKIFVFLVATLPFYFLLVLMVPPILH